MCIYEKADDVGGATAYDGRDVMCRQLYQYSFARIGVDPDVFTRARLRGIARRYGLGTG